MQHSATPHHPPSFDATAGLRWLNFPHAASPWIHEEIAQRMLAKLGFIKKIPASVWHTSPLVGGIQAQANLLARHPKAQFFLSENTSAQTLTLKRLLKINWLTQHFGAKARQTMTLPPHPVDLIWSNMQLHAQPHPPQLLKTWAKALTPDGFMMISCLGPDSFHELRNCYRSLGWEEPAQLFQDMHDWGDLFLSQGFAEPIVDMEHITLTYTSAETLLTELREMGRNLNPNRHPLVRPKSWKKQLYEAISNPNHYPRTADNRLPLTLEVIYIHAVKAPPNMAVSESAMISLEDFRTQISKNHPRQS